MGTYLDGTYTDDTFATPQYIWINEKQHSSIMAKGRKEEFTMPQNRRDEHSFYIINEKRIRNINLNLYIEM